MTKRPIQLTEN